jgi:hypothetical protein
MKTLHKIERSIFIIVVILLFGIIVSSNRPIQVINETNLPEGYKSVLMYNPKTCKFIAKGYDTFTYGPDSSVHVVDIKKGENSLYFVLYDMSINFEITKYDE